MAAAFDNLRDRWERISPRERKMVVILGITFVICLIGWAGMKAKSNMASIEKDNENARKALRALAAARGAQARGVDTDEEVEIPAKAISFDRYLQDIVNEVGIDSPAYPSPKRSEKGQYAELSISVELKGLSIEQMSDFLEKVETKSPIVFVKEMTIDHNHKEREKLDLELVVATFEKKGGEKDKKDDKKKKEKGEDEGEGEDS